MESSFPAFICSNRKNRLFSKAVEFASACSLPSRIDKKSSPMVHDDIARLHWLLIPVHRLTFLTLQCFSLAHRVPHLKLDHKGEDWSIERRDNM